MKKVVKFFFSMKFALILLVILALSCTVGSLIPQGETLSYYQETYSTQLAGAIMLFGLNDVFHCAWFIVLTLLLCANLLGCNILHFPSLFRRTINGFSPEKAIRSWNREPVAAVSDPEALFQKTGFRKITRGTDENGQPFLYAVKNKIGIWGAWLTHLGMLIIIVGFGLGQMTKTEYTVYGVPGETKQIGDTKYALAIDDFQIGLRADETVEQYTSWLTMTDTVSGESKSGTACVNAPLSLYGMKLYQNSTGWAATVEVSKDGAVLQSSLLCAGEYMLVDALPGVAVMFSSFYPDYTEDANGKSMTASSFLNNPGYLYRLYYHDQVLGMKVLNGDDVITVEDYQIRFKDPQSYTLIQIKQDRFTGVAAFGGLVILAALILAFYLRTGEIWAVGNEDGTWSVAGKSRKGGVEFLEMIRNAAREETGNE